MAPLYDLADVQPMIDELTQVGVRSLTTPGEVEEAVLQTKGTTLLVVNSVCRCTAGDCRDGVTAALQHKTIPDNIATVFAGMDTEAVKKARDLMPDVPPSSPCIAIFKDGKLLAVMERKHIEQMTVDDVTEGLTRVFDNHCSRKGPSVDREVFESYSEAPRSSFFSFFRKRR